MQPKPEPNSDAKWRALNPPQRLSAVKQPPGELYDFPELTMALSSRVENIPVTARRVVYLSPTSAPYRVPVLETLYRCIGEGFTVVMLRHPRLDISRVALGMGTFPRRIIKGLSFSLSRLGDRGQATPLCLFLSPSLPLVLTSLKPEVVISNNFNLWTLTSILMGYPTVLFWEGTHHTERTVGPWRMRLRRWIGSRAKAFVVNGILSSNYLTEAVGVPGDRIIEGGMCPQPPPAHIRPGPRTLRPEDPLRCLFVGRLIAGKGVPHLLRAAQLLDRRLRNEGQFEILLLGDGPERSRYENLAQELGIRNRVHFAGYVSPGQVWRYYEQAHVFVLPTLQDNWPLVVPEAMSMGLPMLLSKYAGSVPDLIREGENGHSFDPEDHEFLASHLEEYVRNPDLIRRHGERSLEIVSSYNPERAANALLWAVAKAKEGTAV
jgi:glycosyltransferase involved in cell wall biosynthesis